MDIYIHKDLLGFDQHLSYKSGKFTRVRDIPEGDSIVYGDPELLELAKLYNITLPEFPPSRYVKAFQTTLRSRDVSEVPWKDAIPPEAFKRIVKGLGESLEKAFSETDFSYYRTHYRKTMKALSYLRQAKIDPRAWKVHSMDPDLITPHVFHSFQPDEDGFTSPVVYSRCDTKTGRLKVVEGPNILTLPKEQRNVLSSRFGMNGKVWSLDYSSLEPRVLLSVRDFLASQSPLTGSPPQTLVSKTESDVYTSFLTRFQITTITRAQVKEVVLSLIYGAGQDTIMEKLQGVKDPRGFIDAVNDFFGLDLVRQRLVEEWEANGRQYITTLYGRKLDTSDAKPYMLLNYLIQSMAVEVALYGFLNILRAITTPLIVPLFIQHDALIVDAHKDAFPMLESLCALGSRNIPLFEGSVFPLKVSRF